MTALPLAGKTALITGASAGIGRATALALASRGANIVVTARREDRLHALCAEITSTGGHAVFHAGDAAAEPTALAAINLAIETFGHLDILINNAGIGNYKNLVDTSAEDYDAMMDTNMRSGFLFSRHAAPLMVAQRSGTILFISSVSGLQGIAGEAIYSASKFAQVGFSQALDAELRKHNIKVGVVCPGGVKSEFALNHGRTEDFIRNLTQDGRRRGRRSHPLRLSPAPERPHSPAHRPPHGLTVSPLAQEPVILSEVWRALAPDAVEGTPKLLTSLRPLDPFDQHCLTSRFLDVGVDHRDYRRSTTNGTPLFGRKLIAGLYAISCGAPTGSDSFQSRAITASTNTPSIHASPSPMHCLLPPANGKKA